MIIKYKLSKPQKDFVNSKARFTVFNAGRSSGKTFTASLIAVRALLEQKKVIIFAQTKGTLRDCLMLAIRERLEEIATPMGIEVKCNENTFKVTYGNGAIYGMSYENIEACRGFTNISVAIYDEIALAPPNLLSTVVYCLRGKDIEPRQYAMTTPRFGTWWNKYLKDHSNDPNIKIIHSTIFDLNNKENDDLSIIKTAQIENMIANEIDETMLRQELYGEIVDDNTAGVIFSADLLDHAGFSLHNDVDGYAIGIDCSGLGKDSHVILVRNQTKILQIVEKKLATESELCNIVRHLIDQYGKSKLSHICIDEAYGLGLAERLREVDITPVLVPFGGSPKNKAFANNRAEMYMNLKKGIESNGLFGITSELYRELQATKYILNQTGKIQIIPKDDIKLNLGRSPDIADALALTYYSPIVPSETYENIVRNTCRYLG